MNRSARWMVHWLILGIVMTGTAQAEPPADPVVPPGFHTVASLENFTPQGRPAVVEGHGLVVPGIVRSEVESGIETIAYLWFVTANTYEALDTPVDQDDSYCDFRLVCLNARGQLLVNVSTLDVATDLTVGMVYVREPDGVWIMVAPHEDQDELARPEDFYGHDMNIHGTVVGVTYSGVGGPSLGCYQWSRVDGLSRYQDSDTWYIDDVYEINDDGVAVGQARDAQEDFGTRIRPIVCYDTDDVVVLEDERDSGRATATRISNTGLVVLKHFYVPDGGSPYQLWDAGLVGERLPATSLPVGEMTCVAGLSDADAVLILRIEFERTPTLSRGFLVRGSDRYVLPVFPGVPDGCTFYSRMSREGWIVGYAAHERASATEVGQHVAFAVSPDTELELDD